MKLKYHFDRYYHCYFCYANQTGKKQFLSQIIIRNAPLLWFEKLPSMSSIAVKYILEVISPVLFFKSAISIE